MAIRKPRKPRFTGKHTIIVDWDGTAVKNTWPDKTAEWMPGFVAAVRRWHKAGLAIVIHSSRFNPHNPYTMQEDDWWRAEAKANAMFIRSALDQEGLSFVGVWDKPGKPTGSVYVDDKAERYNGHVNSWKGVCDKVLLRLGNEEAAFPDYVGKE